jgi:hypothetical protein
VLDALALLDSAAAERESLGLRTVEEAMDITIRVDELGDERVAVAPMGGNRFQLEETPVLVEGILLGDVVELRKLEDGRYQLSAVLQRPFVHGSCVIPGAFAQSNALYDFGEWVESLGGRWECLAHGFLFIHLPRGVKAKAKDELRTRIKAFFDSGGLSSVDEVRRRECGGAEPPARSGHITVRAADAADES